MTTLRLDASPAALDRAAEFLRSGALVAFPTETVYGLGVDAANAGSVAALYEAKGRPRFNPLIAHVPSMEAACREGVFDLAAERLARTFWPGPLSLVVPRAPGSSISAIAAAGLDTLALRVPAHPVALTLLELVGRPVAAPSANRSGHVSPTRAAHVLADLEGRIAAVVDAGPSAVGVESTVVACVGGVVRLLRPGGIARAAVEMVLGAPVLGPETDEGGAPAAPGMLASHYAPRACVRLDAEAPGPGEAWLGFGPDRVPPGPAVRNLSPVGDLTKAAAHLFDMLRDLDTAAPAAIAVAPIPNEGLGEAIRDRLSRAAAQR